MGPEYGKKVIEFFSRKIIYHFHVNELPCFLRPLAFLLEQKLGKDEEESKQGSSWIVSTLHLGQVTY